MNGNELKYVIFYLFDKRENIYRQMSPNTPIYENNDWLIYDLKQSPKKP